MPSPPCNAGLGMCTMSDKLFDALENCLQALERGDTIETAVARYPALADELRPILEASLNAKSLGGVPVPREVHARGLNRVLHAAADMRVASRTSKQRTWVFSLRPLAIALMLTFFFLTSTGLVSASSTALPGDNLYPVKRTWEDVQLILSPPQKRELLHMQFEQERVLEVEDLLDVGRSEAVAFSGYVTSKSELEWMVSGVLVKINTKTKLPVEAVPLGRAVTVTGLTVNGGFIEAQTIVLLDPNVAIPTPFEIESHNGGESGNDDGNQINNGGASTNDGNDNESDDEGGGSSNTATPAPRITSTPKPSSTPEPTEGSDDNRVKFDGAIVQMNGAIWIIGGRSVDVSDAQVNFNPYIGAKVKVEGYKSANGVIVATRISLESSDGGGGGGGDGGGGGGGSGATPTPTHDDD